jgi:hypothetical protein
MSTKTPAWLAPDDLARLKARLSEMVEEFMLESDPKQWADSSTAESQKRRYYAKRHAEITLNQVKQLAQVIAAAEGMPSPKDTPQSKATTATVKAARAKAQALREGAGIEGPPN